MECACRTERGFDVCVILGMWRRGSVVRLRKFRCETEEAMGAMEGAPKTAARYWIVEEPMEVQESETVGQWTVAPMVLPPMGALTAGQ
jgi:hypothetical protein